MPGWDEDDDEIGIPAGLFDSDFDETPSLHIMIASKAKWYQILDGIAQYDEFPEEW